MKLIVAILFTVTCCHPAEADDSRFDQLSLGVAAGPIPTSVKELKWPTHKGVIVFAVWKGSPADKAGMKQLDIITVLGGKKITNLSDFDAAKKSLTASKTAVSVYRLNDSTGNPSWRQTVARMIPVPYKDIVDSQVVRKYDEANGVTRFDHCDNPKTVNEKDYIDASLAENSSSRHLNLLLTYNAKDWLFIRDYTIVVDGKRFPITAPPLSVKRDVGKTLCEWYVSSDDVKKADSETMQAARGVAELGTAKLYSIGERGRKEREIDFDEQARVFMILEYNDLHPFVAAK